MQSESKSKSSWKNSLGRKAWKTALVVVLLLVFGQWYLPRQGYKLAAGSNDPGYQTQYQFRLQERQHLRDSLLYSGQESTKYRIWDNGLRASRPQWADKRPHRVLLIGDDWTFGVGVEDKQTCAWLLGKMFPSCAFDNAGMPGYGPYAAMLSMQEYMVQQHYDLVLYLATDRQLYSDGAFYAEAVSKRQDPRDAVYMHAYSGLQAPARGESKPRLKPHLGGCLSWPGDRSLYLVNFAKNISSLVYAPLSLQLNGYGKYSCFLSNEKRAAQRLRLFMDAMESYARTNNSAFGLVGLDELFYILDRNSVFSEASSATDNIDWRASFPRLDAHYPVEFRNYRELCTKHTALDSGKNPGPKVQAYFAQTIGTWLTRPEVAGEWIGRVLPVAADTGVRAGKCVVSLKKPAPKNVTDAQKGRGKHDEQLTQEDEYTTFSQWEVAPN